MVTVLRAAGIQRLSATPGTKGQRMDIIDRPSPNFGERPAGASVSLIVLHYTAMSGCDDAISRLCDPDCEVSAHYLIAEDGALFRIVDESKRAWHAGAGTWGGQDDVNSRSIGIELDNDGSSPFPKPLMTTLQALLSDLLDRHDLPPKAVIGHSDMAPERKRDPGRLFDWPRLVDAGVSIWPEPAIPTEFLSDAARFGYPTEKGEAVVLEAFRQRFRPDATGPLSAADSAMMAGLARQYAADASTQSANSGSSGPLHSL